MTTFANNPDFREYETLLIRLNDLMAEENDETAEGEQIRDRLEVLHYRLAPAEQERLRGLSADLFMLQDDEILQTPEVSEAVLREQLTAAWQQQNLEGMLPLLRQVREDLSDEARASLRAYAYQGLGHLEPALRFKQLAAKLNPGEFRHQIGVLDILFRLNRREEATPLARRIIADNRATPDVIAAAGYILSQTASEVPEEQGEGSFARFQERQRRQNELLLRAA